MDSLSEPLQDLMMRAARMAQAAGHSEVGPTHLLCGLLEAEPDLAPDLDLEQAKRALPSSQGEFQFTPHLGRILDRAQQETAHLVEPTEKQCLEALLEPGRALALLAHHLRRSPQEWRIHLIAAATGAPALALLPDKNEWRMLLTCLENPNSQLRTWMDADELASALEWVAAVAHPFPPVSDTGWLAIAKANATRQAGLQPLSRQRFFHALLHEREVALLHWRLGGNWLKPAARRSFWHSPGLAVADHYNHSKVTTLHVLSDCLSEPILQAPLNALRQAIRKVLEGGPRDSPTPVAAVLRRTLQACRRWNVEPARIHLAYILVRHFATGDIAEAMEWSGRDANAWLERLRRPMLGRLRPGDWTVDDIPLGTLLGEQGPLRADQEGWITTSGTHLWADSAGRVCRMLGTSLKSQGAVLLGPESRCHNAETLVGIGRLERWLRYGNVELKVHCNAGCVRHIELRLLTGG